MTIKEIRFFDFMELRRIISKQDFYNNLNEYMRHEHIENIMKLAAQNEPTTENIYKIAKDIFDNSLQDDFYENENEFIQDTMKYINDTCVMTYYTIYEKEVKKA